jgi:hypothetical protein
VCIYTKESWSEEEDKKRLECVKKINYDLMTMASNTYNIAKLVDAYRRVSMP